MAKAKKLEVGKEIETYCNKCKSKMVHVITTIKDDKIKKVMCKGCNNTHVYKPDTADEAPKRKRGRPRKTEGKKIVRRRRKKDWASMVANIDETEAVDYDINADFSEIEAINHKQFGLGVITKILDDNKIEVVFKENQKKILAQNWEQHV